MKRVLVILTLFMTLAVTSNAQKTLGTTLLTGYSLKAGVLLQNNATSTEVELGKTFGKHTISLEGSFTNTPVKNYFAGLEYTRSVYEVGAFDLGVGGAVTFALNRFHALTFSPKVDAGLKLGKYLILEATLASPIYEGSTLFKPINLQAGLKLGVTL